ncbi:hypothetical protein BCF58_0974 [Chryseobacterium defluvii]|uniref:Uncharacterized protein n=1 Tax=Chryseobacterium defluvii TaxID=160396 RepID=A0A495SQS7_9FLAO|nr:hypothetical protein BCF58_0974 [Chryseobacterium defluvii]
MASDFLSVLYCLEMSLLGFENMISFILKPSPLYIAHCRSDDDKNHFLIFHGSRSLMGGSDLMVSEELITSE